MRWLFGLMLIVVGCAESGAELDHGARPASVVQLQLDAKCPAVRVGEIALGSLRITNGWDRKVWVQRVRTRSQSPVSVSFIDAFELTPSSEKTLQLRCAPLADGANVQPIFVETDFGRVTSEVEIKGRAPVAVVVAPAAVEVPFVPGARYASAVTVRLTNSGSEVLRLTAPPSGVPLFDWRSVAIAQAQTAVLRFLVTPSAAGETVLAIGLSTNEPRRGSVSVPVRVLAVERGECALRFDRAAVQPVGLRITNLGPTVCNLSGVEVDGVPGADFARLAPGQSFDVLVDPARVSVSSLVRFYGNRASLQPAAIALFELASTPCLVAAPAELDFGRSPLSCEQPTRWFAVRNVCASPVTLLGELRGSAAFTMPAFAPASVAPGASVHVPVSFAPSVVGDHQGELRWTAIHRGQVTVTDVALWGQSEPLAENVDVFASETPALDFAIVVAAPDLLDGDGGHARRELELMTSTFPGCAQWRVAVVRAGDGGVLVPGADGGEPLITGATLDVIPEMLARIERASVGSSRASLEALAASPSQFPPANVDGRSAMVIASGPDSSPLPVAEYLRQYSTAWPRASTLFVAPVDERYSLSCGTPADNGRLTSFVALSGAGHREYCDRQWFLIQTHGNGGCTWFGELRLNAVPRSPPTVTVNGAVVPSVDARGHLLWTFDSVLNAVRFEPSFVPDWDSVITVRYTPVCPFSR